MIVDVSEKDFESTIVAALGAAYQARPTTDYDRGRCLIPADALAFIQATQPKEWQKLLDQYGAEAGDHFVARLAGEVAKRGTLDVLRKGTKDVGAKLRLAFFPPVSGLNPDIARLFRANVFTVIRQLSYSQKTGQSLDLGLFLNGLPLFTAELKDPLMGQTVEHAVAQYRTDRDPKELLFAFGRCLAHFAVDPNYVYVATRLEGEKTRFLPFNCGYMGGAGNPPILGSLRTGYLWESVWSRESVLNLVQHFVHMVDEEDDKGRPTGKKKLIFPRYHQLDSVRRLVADARLRGPGLRYLIQHSAGSGKSNSIAWLAHQLSVLHDDQDRRIFDSVVVITDRRVLDRQLQSTVRQFQQVAGTVENIDKTSRQLKQALEDGKAIIVSTLQKFPVIAEEIGALPGSRFALIIDEAHSSQTGESTKSLKAVLSAPSLEEAAAEDGAAPEDDLEDRIIAEMKKRGPLANVSTFAFTATPKAKTLELFGTPRPGGGFEAFSLYSMRQAIEERFILDVLTNYTTFRTYWSLLKKIQDDPAYEPHKAVYLLKSYVDLHEHAIGQKVAIIAEHFAGNVAHRIKGRAKAMIVTRSRLHAVRYKQALDAHLVEKGYPFRVLVAFSGTVHDGGLDFTEANMNGFPESHTADAFKRPEYRFLVVANKFQTGFDQSLLHTMYVDKKLGGVNAVQTLSRLNRTSPGKNETMVLDFANEAEDIQTSFAPYYDRTILAEGTDPNLLYDLQQRLDAFGFFTDVDVSRFATACFHPAFTQAHVLEALAPVVERYASTAEDNRADFRDALGDYIRLYAFLSQIITFTDPDLETLYHFSRFLLRVLPREREQLPVEVAEQVNLDSLQIAVTHEGGIPLDPGGPLTPQKPKDFQPLPPDTPEPLSQIIKELNDQFGTDFTPDDKVVLEQLEAKLASNATLAAAVRANTPENALLAFEQAVTSELQELVESNFNFYKQVTDNKPLAARLLAWLFGRYPGRG